MKTGLDETDVTVPSPLGMVLGGPGRSGLMCLIEFPDQVRVQNVGGQHPGSLFRTVYLPVDQVLMALASIPNHRSFLTMKTGSPSRMRGGGVGVAGTKGLS